MLGLIAFRGGLVGKIRIEHALRDTRRLSGRRCRHFAIDDVSLLRPLHLDRVRQGIQRQRCRIRRGRALDDEALDLRQQALTIGGGIIWIAREVHLVDDAFQHLIRCDDRGLAFDESQIRSVSALCDLVGYDFAIPGIDEQ